MKKQTHFSSETLVSTHQRIQLETSLLNVDKSQALEFPWVMMAVQEASAMLNLTHLQMLSKLKKL
jgi:hypothetical protein